MKKLAEWFKALPKEVKALLAVVGLASPVGAIFFLHRYVFPGVSIVTVVIGVVLVVIVVALLAMGITWLFGRKSKARARKMEQELAGSAAGPVSMDLRAAIKSNNERFFGAIREMRKLGISVYDLPWYVVIGDSGCGKTKLINEGGLTFSTGKPEGYQLGTLNYNWWFTEDAIFVDMAGRLCNPQEDSDRREWEAFLNTVSKGRKGYPINGVLLCVSAEHLLQEPPEQHEADANTMLERLRDLQGKLGVTFATYLVITKCDKIVGFMQFFDRAERDITIKNQIFGWSRPGDFSELYEPEGFASDFNELYGRLHELRLRRLNDDADEFELGMAYSFPEEFRELREPLHTYMRTLFPAIKSPRAVKNLIFRGVYFTSATQQGGLILRHLAERLGADAASQLPPLESMYPRPRPHFVKDLLFRKVFPEEGLVFRNEQEVVRNRRLARLLAIGTGAVAVVMLVLLIVSSLQFGRLITEPRGRAQSAAELRGKTAESLPLLTQLGQDVSTLRSSVWPVLLSLGLGADAPARGLTDIQLRLFEDSILGPTLEQTERVLREGRVARPGETAAPGAWPYTVFEPALRTYLAWYGCARGTGRPEGYDFAAYEALAALIPTSADPLGTKRSEVADVARNYFTTVQGRAGWHNPVRGLADEVRSAAALRTGLKALHDHLEFYATLGAQHPNPTIAEWMRIRDAAAQIERSYAAILVAANQPIRTQQELETFRTTFNTEYALLTQAVDGCTWRGPSEGAIRRIPQLRDAVLAQRGSDGAEGAAAPTAARPGQWLEVRRSLRAAYTRCRATPASDDAVIGLLNALVVGDGRDFRGLDRVLAESLRQAGLANREYFPEFFGPEFTSWVQEVDAEYAHILTLARGADAGRDDAIVVNPALRDVIRPVLDQIHVQLAALGSGGTDLATAAAWAEQMQAVLFPPPAAGGGDISGLAQLDPRWKPQELQALNRTYRDLIRKGAGTALLRTMEDSLSAAGAWGAGELASNWRSTQPSAYFIPVPAAVERPRAPETTPTAPPPPTPGGPPPVLPTGGAPPSPVQPRSEAPTPADRPAGQGQIPACASPDFLNARALEVVQLTRFLADFGGHVYFMEDEATTPLHQRCATLVNAAWKKYCDSYVAAWSTAYGGIRLPALDRLSQVEPRWETFAGQFRPPAGGGLTARQAVQDEFQPAFAEIIRAIRWATYLPESGWWLQAPDDYYGAQKRAVAQAYDDALAVHWAHGQFARRAEAPAAAGSNIPRPWEATAAEFTARWGAWCEAVAAVATLPRRFDEAPGRGVPTLSGVPWEGLANLRSETQLGDELLTQRLVEFQQRAQAVLDVELTSIYVGLQDEALGRVAPYRGWPYLNEAGTGLTAMDTVAFEAFRDLLMRIQRAEELLGALEQALPESDVRRRRLAFLSGSTQWRRFMGLDAQGAPAPLDVIVRTSDPLGEPVSQERVNDSAQHYYRRVELNIGLRLQEAGDRGAVRPVEFETTAAARAERRQTVWEWSRAIDLPELTFQLMDGLQPERQDFRYPPIKPRVLGRPSALALCAFLHRYGTRHEGTWLVTLGVNLAEKFREAGNPELVARLPRQDMVVGERFLFQLPQGRDLPEPITPLEPAVLPPR